jgi:hypothetical protein
MAEDYTITLERSQLVHLIVLLKMQITRNETLLTLPPDKALLPDSKGITEADLRSCSELLLVLETAYDSKV